MDKKISILLKNQKDSVELFGAILEKLELLEERMNNLEDDVSKLRDDLKNELSLFQLLNEHIEFRNGSLVLKNTVLE